MKKKMKKIIAIVLTATMVMGVSIPAFANDSTFYMESVDSTVGIVTPYAFQNAFVSKTSKNIGNMTIEQVSYDYTFVQDEEDAEKANVSLSFIMFIGSQEYPVNVSGQVNAYSLSSGDILWEGPIEGTAIINGQKYDVLTGFSKLDSSSSIQASVTLQASDEEILSDPIVFTFGDTVLTKEIHDDIMSQATVADMSDLETGDEGIVPYANSFTYVASPTAYFSNSVTGLAQQAYIQKDSISDELSVAIKTYCNNVNTYYSNAGYTYPVTFIDSFNVNLSIPSGQGYSHAYIAGVRNDSRLNNNSGSLSSVSMYAFFCDVLNALGVPTNTVSNVLGSLKGSVNYSGSTNYYNVGVSFGITQLANFDTLSNGIPIVFQIGVTSDYAGNTRMTFGTSLRYRTQLGDSSGTSYQWVYTSAKDISYTATVTI